MSLFYSAGLGGSAIPDAGDLQARYDAKDLSLSDGDSVTTWGDATGNGHDLTPGSAPTYVADGLNGNPVVRFDGVGDFLDVVFPTLAQPNHIFAAYRYRSTDASQQLYDSASSTERNTQTIDSKGNVTVFAGTLLLGPTPDTDGHISAAKYNGADSSLRLDGSLSISGDAGSQGLGGLTVGTGHGHSSFGAVDVAELLIYPQDKTSVETDVEQHLSGEWGIPV